MIKDLGHWPFYGIYKADYSKVYPTIKASLRILLENLISSRILLPTRINQRIPLQYSNLDELMDQIEATGNLDTVTDFDLFGDTIIYTPTGEEMCHDIISIMGFRTPSPHFTFVVHEGDWLPMTMDHDTEEFKWNLERYYLNYHRIPALLKKLDVELGWENKELTLADDYFSTLKSGYDFFINKTIIAREYRRNANDNFDIDAYLATIKETVERYPY